MYKKVIVILIVLLFLVATIIPIISGYDYSSTTLSTTRYVGGSGLGNHTTIQSAIDAASSGDTVFVYNGTYFENVVVDKTIDLIGGNRTTTIIDGSSSFGEDIVQIIANEVNIIGFTIKSIWSQGYTGICVESDYCNINGNILIDNGDNGITVFGYSTVIKDNIFDNNGDGIGLEGLPTGHIVCGNIIVNSTDDGVYGGNNNTISENIISYNAGCGLYIGNGTYNTIFGNTILNNGEYGIYLLSLSINNYIFHNNFYSTGAYDESNNYWDNGYPSGGNYWTNYSGADIHHGPNQDIPGSDGIGDIPYPVIGGNNQDNYPLMQPWTTSSPVIDISVDIKPGDYPNTINPKSKGKVPVAILTTEDLNASEVNPDSIDFLSASTSMWSMDDVDKDGDVDLLLKFKTQECNFSLLVDEGDEYPYAYLIGETISGELIEGKDTIRLVGHYTYFKQILVRLIQRFPILVKILNLFY